MSQIVTIKSQHRIENIELAKQVVDQSNMMTKIQVTESGFVFIGYQHDDGYKMKRQIEDLEQQYFKLLQDVKKTLVIANAKKQGYTVKQEIRQDKTIKLVLQKRVY